MAHSSTTEMTPEGDKERAGIQSVEVGFALLDVLAQAPGPLMLRDLASAAGMSAAKAHRYLVSFQRLNLVVQDANTRYELGPATLRLGLATLSRLDEVKLARERLPTLMDQTGHTLALAVWGNHGPTLVHWQEAPLAMPVSLRLGDVMPLLSSATGRCFAAFMGHGGAADKALPMIDAELAMARKLGRSDLPSTPAQVQAMNTETRAQGLGRVVNVLLPGISGFCAPVFDADGHLALGVVSLGSTATLDTDWKGPVAQALRAFSVQLSFDLGWSSA
ncbi:IclR family transcriptional regulator [Limnohabitans sp. Rim28]|uniref:IclR family transcriptional regulator n=1 Tax=Limnohabitans sp. Rim28 TaxID=1100720 RepID=UPI0002DF9CA0|nr:IclR family transcriptional regulator [Limnohabitans sp. Rim28]PVE08019.1 IclR family transcriptional regulator [Limnohabitans sp. Rim28]